MALRMECESDLLCKDLHKSNISNLCAFIESNEDCQDLDGNFFNYLRFIYCDFGNHFTVLGLIIYIVWLIILFATLAITADHFFCPNLEVLARTLRLSQNLAGVTFLAFGNGAPEIFASIAGVHLERPELVVSSLFGSGLFLTSVVAGSIIIISPFKMVERPFLRDVIFYMGAAYVMFLILYYRKITLHYALGFIVLYIIYIGFVLIAHHVYQWLKRKAARKNGHGHETPVDPETRDQSVFTSSIPLRESLRESIQASFAKSSSIEESSIDNDDTEITPWGHPPFIRHWSSDDPIVSDEEEERDEEETSLISNVRDQKRKRTPAILEDGCTSRQAHREKWGEKWAVRRTSVQRVNSRLESTEGSVRSVTVRHHRGTCGAFVHGINPVNSRRWIYLNYFEKALQVLKAPIMLVLKLTIPLVNYSDRNDNWCRPLNSLHCILSPVFMIISIGYGMETIADNFQVWMLVVIVGGICTMIVFFFTTNNTAPRGHAIFGFIGFLASVVWIYLIATEIVNLLMTIGVVLNVSDDLLGLTVLTWGNVVGDYIADVAIAKQGFPQMGISACFGGPLFILLLGVGIPFTIMTLKEKTAMIEIAYTRYTTIFCSFLFASLVSSLIAFPMMRFNIRRGYGYYLLGLYLTFIAVLILNEAGVWNS